MGYEVTATRKRPQSFDELVGQEFVASTLKNSIKAGRIAHAYLFSGPRGVGKTSAARILAKALNCQEGPTDSPCGRCTSCLEITRGNSLDVIEIDGASNTSVNDVREIKDEVLFAPNSSRYKVYIIDEVHMLSNSAFNALLKTIEEPPPYIVFIFATTELHKVPATIKSRCQQFNFRLVHPEAVKGLLTGICDELGVKAEEDALFWIAKESTGSLRDAYTLFDQVVSFSDGEITLAKIREKLGLVGLDNLNELTEILTEGDAGKALEYLDEVLERGVSVEQFIADFAEYMRSLLFLKNGITREAVLGYAEERFSRKAIESYTVSQLEKAVDLLLELYRNVRYSLNPRFELELLVSRFASLGSFFSHREMMKQLEELRRGLVSGFLQDAADAGPAGRSSFTENTVPRIPESGRPDPSESSTAGEPLQKIERPWERKSPGPENRAGGVYSRETQSRIDQDDDDEPEPDLESIDTRDVRSSVGTGIDPEGSVRETAGRTATAVADPAGASPDDLLGKLVALVRKKKLALSSALEKAVSWKLEGDTLRILFDSSFSASFVRQDIAEVTEKARELLARPVKVTAEVRESDTQGQDAGTDEQVELVKRVFRGQVVKGE
jgi:DNA polymerase-3 subunit gamma/tau